MRNSSSAVNSDSFNNLFEGVLSLLKSIAYKTQERFLAGSTCTGDKMPIYYILDIHVQCILHCASPSNQSYEVNIVILSTICFEIESYSQKTWAPRSSPDNLYHLKWNSCMQCSEGSLLVVRSWKRCSFSCFARFTNSIQSLISYTTS